MHITTLIESLETFIKNPSDGLPEDIFLFVTRITPIINVDLLIKNEHQHTLLTWRDDGYWEPGWHIPGGIIRYKETTADRIHAVAATELGANVAYKKKPLAIKEFIHPTKQNRGHCISLLYACKLTSPLAPTIKYTKGTHKHGEWAWHATCPDNIISVHHTMYRKFI